MQISNAYGKPLKYAFVTQCIVLLLASITLDCGRLFAISLFCFLGFWSGAGLIIFRRPAKPTQADLVFITVGYLLLIGGCMALEFFGLMDIYVGLLVVQ